MNSFKKDNQGVAAILSVVVIGIVVLLLSRASVSIGQVDLSIVNNQIHASQAKSNAETCLKEALWQIDHKSSFIGDANLILNKGICDLKVATSGPDYLLEVKGVVLDYTKRINGLAEIIDGQVVLKNWEER